VVRFYNGTAGQHIKKAKNARRWTRLSCHTFRHNAVRLQLLALAYNLANFLRTLALPVEVEHWSLTTLREKLMRIGARSVRDGRHVVFQLAEVAVLRALFARSSAGSRGSGRGHFRHDGDALGVSITTGRGAPEIAPWGLDVSVRGYRGAEKQRGAPRITASGPQGLVARTH
jgi:Transposase DDE domain group 1